MKNITEVCRRIEETQNELVETYRQFLEIASVSADSKYAQDCKSAAKWLVDKLGGMGFYIETHEKDGHPPIIVGKYLKAGDAPTVMIYGHYDVQPVDPPDLWETPPFSPDIRDGHVYARGASDDKGQFLTHIFAAAAWLEETGSLPVNLIFLSEGEEEIGSEWLTEFVQAQPELLPCDVIVISDGNQFAPSVPAITYALRGVMCFEVNLTGPNRDLHSGSFGGAVTNAGNVLAELVASLVGPDGRIQVPGFYDDVEPMTDRERQLLSELPLTEERFFGDLGTDGGRGEEGYTALERRWARPSCDVNGLTCGYQGEGAKTVLPDCASAKFSFRLVPNQQPDKIAAGVRELFEPQVPSGIEMKLEVDHGSPGILVSLESPFVECSARAIEAAFGTAPVYAREGGSIPIVATMAQQLRADVLLLGWGQADNNIHSPNERFSLEDFRRGTLASARLLDEIGKMKK